jgi:enoyl-[acyl-carrier protein] reductase II
MKQLTPVRLIKNSFYHAVAAAELAGASKAELQAILGRARAKRGMFEGDMDEGELEIGQASALISELMPVADVVKEMMTDCLSTLERTAKRL